MQEDLSALVRTQAMQLFRQQGLHFTMQQVAEPPNLSCFSKSNNNAGLMACPKKRVSK